MIEITFLLLIATGGLFLISKPGPFLHGTPLSAGLRPAWSVPIARNGRVRVARPGDVGVIQGFAELQFSPHGLRFLDARGQVMHTVRFEQIQWVSAATIAPHYQHQIHLHVKAHERWLIVSLQVAEPEMILLGKILQRTIPSSRRDLTGQYVASEQLVTAYVIEESLQGEVSIGPEVQLLVLPRALVVLKGDVVQAQLDMHSIRRILTVEKNTSHIRNLWKPAIPAGLIRLYSMHETVVFAVPEFRTVAREIAYFAQATVEDITRVEKNHKR